MRARLIYLFLSISTQALCQGGWNTVTTNLTASFRGVSVVDDKVAWVSGSGGWVGRTVNGGVDWNFKQIENFDKVDFRAIYAFDGLRAVIANAGSPANILLTQDGGKSWTSVYRNEHQAAFFDGMDFWNENEGVAYGDPIGGRMLLVRTEDGGKTWKDLSDGSRPLLSEGEASFAASGTGIRCRGKGDLLIATGGTVSRLLVSHDKGLTWSITTPPVIQGKASTGIFSVACWSETNWIVTGGDFAIDTLKMNHIFLTLDGGKTWQAPATPTRGYREAVEFISVKTVIAVGQRGSDISRDGGKNWIVLSDDELFHTVRKARKGELIVMSGGKGKIKVKKGS